nr:CAP [Fur seal circovirus]
MYGRYYRRRGRKYRKRWYRRWWYRNHRAWRPRAGTYYTRWYSHMTKLTLPSGRQNDHPWWYDAYTTNLGEFSGQGAGAHYELYKIQRFIVTMTPLTPRAQQKQTLLGASAIDLDGNWGNATKWYVGDLLADNTTRRTWSSQKTHRRSFVPKPRILDAGTTCAGQSLAVWDRNNQPWLNCCDSSIVHGGLLVTLYCNSGDNIPEFMVRKQAKVVFKQLL